MRSISSGYVNSVRASSSEEADLIFLTAIHPSLADPVRVVNDGALPKGKVIEYHRQGVIFYGMPFEVSLLTDEEKPPVGQLKIIAVDRRVGEAVRRITDSPRIKLELLKLSDFTREADPDDHIWTDGAPPGAQPEMVQDYLRLTAVTGDATWITAQLHSFDLSREPFPFLRATADRLPGVHL